MQILLSRTQAGPGRAGTNFSQPRTSLLADLCTETLQGRAAFFQSLYRPLPHLTPNPPNDSFCIPSDQGSLFVLRCPVYVRPSLRRTFRAGERTNYELQCPPLSSSVGRGPSGRGRPFRGSKQCVPCHISNCFWAWVHRVERTLKIWRLPESAWI